MPIITLINRILDKIHSNLLSYGKSIDNKHKTAPNGRRYK